MFFPRKCTKGKTGQVITGGIDGKTQSKIRGWLFIAERAAAPGGKNQGGGIAHRRPRKKGKEGWGGTPTAANHLRRGRFRVSTGLTSGEFDSLGLWWPRKNEQILLKNGVRERFA